MRKRHFVIILMACIPGLIFGGSSIASAQADDPLAKLVRLISYKAERPALNITQASVSNCTLTVETLRRAPDRSIISRSTTVFLPALHGNTSVFFLSPDEEDSGARFSFFVTEETASATYRIDNPSSSSRRYFRKRFGQRCWGTDMCKADYVPKSLEFSVQSDTLVDRTELKDTFQDAIDYCRRQAE